MAEEPKKPMGEPIEWTDDLLTEMSIVRPSDLAAGEKLWQNGATRHKKLLQADVVKKPAKKRKKKA
jgi:hypothetical protein